MIFMKAKLPFADGRGGESRQVIEPFGFVFPVNVIIQEFWPLSVSLLWGPR